MDRRRFCADTGRGLLLVSGVLGGCKQAPRKDQVLLELGREIALPDMREAGRASQALDRALGSLTRAPSASALAQACEAWRSAILAWKRVGCVSGAPALDTHALLRATFWPPRPAAIEAALSAPGDTAVGFFDQLGSDARGLFALEVLLFPASGTPGVLERLGAANGRRYASYLGALAQQVTRLADQMLRAAGEGDAFAHTFARAGQGSVIRLVGQMVATVEDIVAHRLNALLGIARARAPRTSDVQGGPSGLSQRLAVALLTRTRELYAREGGLGLGDLVHAVAAPIDEQIRAAFEVASRAMAAIPGPLEQAAHTQPGALQSALVASKTLEVALKTGLSSALGVTLSFGVGDGD